MLKCKIFDGNCYSVAREFNDYVEEHQIEQNQIVLLKYNTVNRNDDRHHICLIYDESLRNFLMSEEEIIRMLNAAPPEEQMYLNPTLN